MVLAFYLENTCLCIRNAKTERAAGFLQPRDSITVISCSRSSHVGSKRRVPLRPGVKGDGNGRVSPQGLRASGSSSDILGDDSSLLFAQDGDSKDEHNQTEVEDSVLKDGKQTDTDIASEASDQGSSADMHGTVRVMYSGGSNNNLVVDEDSMSRQGSTDANNVKKVQATTPAVEPVGHQSQSGKSGDPQKDNLYAQLKRMFYFVSVKLKEENAPLHETLNNFIRDLKWDVWQSAAVSQTTLASFHSSQRKHNETVAEEFKKLMSSLVNRWEGLMEAYAPLGRLPLIKLTKPLGVQDQRDVADLRLLIEELLDSYNRTERVNRWSMLKSVQQHILSKIVSAVDVLLPFRPASKLVSFCNSIHSFIQRTCVFQGPQHKGKLSFNEEGIFKYYEMPRSYIHTPEGWPKEYQPLPPQGGGPWKVTFLGTGSRRSTRTRMTSAILFARLKHEAIWLFDCGESAISRVRDTGVSAMRVRKIFITHLHGDHCFGLFSFLYGATNSAPLEVYGPSGTARFILDVLSATSRSQTIRTFVVNELVSPGEKEASPEETKSMEKVFKVNYIHHDDNMQYSVCEDDTCIVKAAPLSHTINTVGYVVEEKQETSQVETQVKPRKFVLCQDTADSKWLKPLSMDADLLIHEATINAPTNSGSEMLMRLARRKHNLELPRSVMDKLDRLVLTEEIKFQIYQCTIGNISYYYDRKMRALRGALQLQQDIKKVLSEMGPELSTAESASQPSDTPSDAAGQTKEDMSDIPNWASIVKNLTNMLKLYGDAQQVEKLVSDVENLGALIRELRSSAVQGMKSFKSRSMQINMGALAQAMLEKEGYLVDTHKDEELETILTVSRAIDKMAPLIFQYWSDAMGRPLPSGEDGLYKREQWETLYNEYAKFSGHSTCYMAGGFAAKVRAKKLLLTHFSHNLPDAMNRENILTMTRVVHSALRGYYHHIASRDTKNLTVGAAWDMLTLTL